MRPITEVALTIDRVLVMSRNALCGAGLRQIVTCN
ncbi:hypothetical protein KLNKPBOH_02242 [Aeromonas veronii]